MTAADEPNGEHARLIADWLFLLLRFALTRNEIDREAVETLARRIDGIGQYRSDACPGFFERTAGDVCIAICDSESPQSVAVLMRHMRRIENVPLRKCFSLATGLAEVKSEHDPAGQQARPDLWRGLPTRPPVHRRPNSA